MHCYIYKGLRRDDHYLYLLQQLEEVLVEQSAEQSADATDPSRDGLMVETSKPALLESPEHVPGALLDMLGELSFVVDFNLTADRKLPQADAGQVLEILADQGFYLQMPKKDMIAEENQLFS